MSAPFVSVVVPARDEPEHIGLAVQSLVKQTYPADRFEVLVAEAGSVEETAGIVDDVSGGRYVVLHNPRRSAAAGLNEAIRDARGDIIARLDAHAIAPPDYLERGVRLLAETGAWSVGGWVDPVTPSARADAMGYGVRPVGGWVETAPFGMWPRWVFDRIGLFDEGLGRNQDDEFSLRIRRAGGRIWQDPELRFGYVPRSSWLAFARQHFGNGRWKVPVWRKHGHRPTAREVWPAAWLSLLVLGGLLRSPLLIAAATVPYVAVAARRGSVVAYATRHLSYGAGLLRGLVR